MENNNYSNFYSALGAYRILLITFIILKLTDNIDWSWWWVTSPLWDTSCYCYSNDIII